MHPTAVVTGAAGDLGSALCRALVKEGWRVLGADINPVDTPGVEPYTTDVRDREAVQALADAAAPKLKLWVNAAGVIGGGRLGEADEQTWDRLIAVNLTGTFHGCEVALAAMKAGGGRIVNVGSLAGQNGGVAGMHPGYGAAKAGVHSLTRTYASGGARHGVLCNAVAPGVLEGSMAAEFPDELIARIAKANPTGRLGTMDDVVKAVLFLGDERRSGYVNGVVLSLNGGVWLAP